MKTNRTSSSKLLTIRLSVGVVFVAIVALSLYTVSVGRDKDAEKDPHGWAWNAYSLTGSSDAIGLGWVSLNCLNDFDNDSLLEYQCDATKPYGVFVDDSDNGLEGTDDFLKGCAWSGAYGWVCFNGGYNSTHQCDAFINPACLAGPRWNAGVSIYQHSSGNFFYLRPPTFSSVDQTWSLSGTDVARMRGRILSLYDSSDIQKSFIGFPFTDDATRNPLDASYVGSAAMAQLSIPGCFNCDAETGQCGACLNVSTEAASDSNPNPNILCWGCTDCQILEDGGSCVTNRDRNVCQVSSCSACTDMPGVIINQPTADSYEMCGWAWHGYDPGAGDEGLGWIVFNSETNLGDIAYIGVDQGTILSLGNIYAPGAPPQGQYNSAFIIEASGNITNWYSENAYRFENAEDLPSFLTQDGSGTYSNVLGSIDFTGLITDVNTGIAVASGETSTNKYGQTLYGAGDSDLLDIDLSNSVQYYNDSTGTTTVDMTTSYWYTETTMLATDGTDPAAYVIVVDGNLNIIDDVFYETFAQYATRVSGDKVSSLKQVPSMIWIVRGDVIIDPSVTDVAGTFIVLGDPNVASCPELTEDRNGCGRFISGSGANQLTIYGTVMARQFSFERSYGTGGQPSEQFQPEGRLQANPPAGFTDFAESVPRFSTSN